jgi:hypothetical protein
LIFLVLNQQVWYTLAACDDLAVISNRAVFNEAGIDSLRHWFDLLLDLAPRTFGGAVPSEHPQD